MAAEAQSAPEALPRFEAGTQYAFLGKGYCYKTRCNAPPEVALGATLTWNITPNLSMDSVMNVTATEGAPRRDVGGLTSGGREFVTAVGPRFEVRRNHFGLFVYGQLGAETWTNAPPVIQYGANYVPVIVPPPAHRTFFSAGAGGGAEYSPTTLWHLRVATGQRIVNYGTAYRGAACPGCQEPGSSWIASEDLTAGVTRGFGGRLQSRVYGPDLHPHRFFDTTNSVLITGAVLANVGDAVTTQRFLDRGVPEGNAIERTFVQRGVPGHIGLGAIAGAAGVGAMYGLHKMGHHRFERILPVALLVLGAHNTYRNAKAE